MCEACWSHLRLAAPLIEHYPSTHALSVACAVDHYDGRMKEIIHALKYERRRSIAPPLGALMREHARVLLQDADVVVPVPLHPRREYERGFNQAEDLAAHLGKPLVRMLARVRHTHSQIDLPKEQRHANVKAAFALSIPGSRIPIPDVVMLVDDVATTGATIEACAKALKAAGVREIRALTAARVVR